MPYLSTGVYQQVTGATTAQPGDVIRSSTWNSIFGDLGTCLTQLGEQIIQTPNILTAVGNYTATTADYIILVQASVPVITLPVSSTRSYPLRIIGAAAGIFSTAPCVITPNGVDTINGLATVTLTSDYQAITLYPLSSGGYIIV